MLGTQGPAYLLFLDSDSKAKYLQQRKLIRENIPPLLLLQRLQEEEEVLIFAACFYTITGMPCLVYIFQPKFQTFFQINHLQSSNVDILARALELSSIPSNNDLLSQAMEINEINADTIINI